MNKSSKVRWFRELIKFVYLVAIVLVLKELSCFGEHLCANGHPVVGRVISAVALLWGGWVVIVLFHKLMQRGFVLILTFLLLFIYGVYIYNVGGTTLEDWWSSILLPMNNTLSIFFPSRGAYDEGLNSRFHDISLHYTLMHLLSYIYIAMLGISLFGRKAMNRSLNTFILPRHKNVFWGYSDGGVLLAKDIMRKSYFGKAVFIMPENMPLSVEVERYRFEEIDGIGGIVMYRNFSKRIKRPRGARHFFLTEDQDLNVKLAFMVLENLKKRKNHFVIKHTKRIFGYKSTTKLYVRTELAHVDRYFSKVLQSLDGVAEVHTINESELTARRFIEKYPPLDMPQIANTIDTKTAEVNGDFKILQLGYGWTGKAVLNKLICNTQFEGKSRFSATIFDRDLKTLHGFYPLLDEECFGTTTGGVNCYNITTHSDTPVGSLPFKDKIEKMIWKNINTKELNYNRIIISLGDDAFNVKIALALANILNSNGFSYKESSKYIFAHIRYVDRCTYFDLAETPISVFGNKDKIYTMDIIVNEQLDELAMEMNYYYTFATSEEYESAKLGKRYTAEKLAQWHKASVLSQESSRAAALAINNTLKLCGYTKTIKKDAASIDRDSVKAKLTNEKLYINEHNRWNAFHFTQGIKCWSLGQINYRIFKGDKPKPNVIEQLNRHAALVSYDDLPKIDVIFNLFRERFNKELICGYCVPYSFNLGVYDFEKIEIVRPKRADNTPLQENDKKFVRDIATILSRVGYKVIKGDD